MLSSKLMQRFGLFTKFAALNAVLPFEWHQRGNKFTETSYKTKVLLWRTRICLVWFVWIFLLGRLAESYLVHGAKVTDLTIHCLWCGNYSLHSVLHLNTFLRWRQIAIFLNQFFYLNQAKGFKDSTHRVNRSIEKFMRNFGSIAIFHTILTLFIFMDHPEKRQYLGSVFLKLFNHPSIVVFFGCYEFLQSTFNWSMILVYMFIILSYMTVMGTWLFNLRSRLATCESPSDHSQCRFEFQKLLLLNHRFKDCCYPVVITGHRLVLVGLTIAGSYGTLNLFHLTRSRPKVYGVYFVTTTTAMVFQYFYYKASTFIFQNARAVQGFLMHNSITDRKDKRFSTRFQGLPRRCDSFSIFNQWTPPQFFKKIIFACIKMHFYLHSNVSIFKKSNNTAT